MIRRALERVVGSAIDALPLGMRSSVLERAIGEATVTSRVGDRTLRMVATAPLLLSRAQNLLTKETDTIQWINGFREGSVFWDVGANIGTFTLYAALNRSTTVVAFEPGAANYDVLCRNILLNSLGNTTAYCVAFARDTRLGVLNMPTAAVGAALNQFGAKGDVSRFAEPDGENKVQGMLGFSIDDFIERFAPPFPAYLKLDVDGIESDILQGAEKTLRDARLTSVLAELTISDADDLARATAFLTTSGFVLKSLGEIQTSGGQTARNHIFVRGGR